MPLGYDDPNPSIERLMVYGANKKSIIPELTNLGYDVVIVNHPLYYRNGKENGLWKQWHKNGQLKSNVKFINGIKQGIETIWDKNGVIRSKDDYINGKVIKK